MIRSVPGVGDVVALLEVAYDQDVKYPAAALAYYAFVSLVPLLVLTFAAFGQRFADNIDEAMALYLTPAARELFREALVSVSGRTGAVLLSIGVLAWAGGNVALGFQTVVARIEGTVDGQVGWPSRIRSGVVVLVSLTLAGTVVVATSVISLALVDGVLVGVALGVIVLLVSLTVVLLPMYYTTSRVVDSLRSALPGAFVAGTGWTVLHLIVRLYVELAPQYAVYGALSGVILLLTSLYVASILLMLGVVVNWSYGDG